MAEFDRRSVMAIGVAIATGGTLTSVGASSADNDCPCQPLLDEPEGWSAHGGNVGNNRHVPSDETFGPAETIAWQYESRGRPAIVSGTVYLTTVPGHGIHALDADDGSLRWANDGIEAHGTPAVTDEAVYVGGEQLTALDASTGDVNWTREFETEESVPAPLAAFGTIYVPLEGTLYAVDAADGSLRWRRDAVVVDSERSHEGSREATFRPSGTWSSRRSVVATHGALWTLIEAEGGRGAVAQLDPKSGDVEWSGYLGIEAETASTLAVADETLVFTSTIEESISYFDTAAKEEQGGISDAFDVAIADDVVVAWGRHGLQAESIDSDRSWSRGGSYAHGMPAIVGDTVVVAHDDEHSAQGDPSGDTILGLALEDGSEQWRFEFDDDFWSDAGGLEVVVGDDTVYTNRSGGLTAIRPSGDGDGTGDDDEETSNDDADGGDDTDQDGDESDDAGNESDSDGADGTEDETPEDDGSDGSEDGAEDDGSETDGAEDREDGDDQADDDTGEDDSNENESDAADDVPGFTIGAGLIGSGLTLEWLRRKETTDDPAE